MDDRAALGDGFLAGTRWAEARRVPLAGDASRRRYLRLALPGTGESAVLMDAPPELGEDVRPFVRIARFLGEAGLSAPRILAEDAALGFLLLEDFGDAVFARMIRDAPGSESTLYAAAVDVLVALNSTSPPKGLIEFTPALMAEQAGLVCDTYAGESSDKAALVAGLETFVTRYAAGPPVPILRDYHAENLIWLPERAGVARVGLLDFQDAMAGPAGYDLVSLLHDARRDVAPDLTEAMVRRFIVSAGLDAEAFAVRRAVLCVQRNLRILAVFARLSREQGRTSYIDMIPRVWAHVMDGLGHPALTALAGIVRSALPPPTADHLDRLRTPCR